MQKSVAKFLSCKIFIIENWKRSFFHITKKSHFFLTKFNFFTMFLLFNFFTFLFCSHEHFEIEVYLKWWEKYEKISHTFYKSEMVNNTFTLDFLVQYDRIKIWKKISSYIIETMHVKHEDKTVLVRFSEMIKFGLNQFCMGWLDSSGFPWPTIEILSLGFGNNNFI